MRQIQPLHGLWLETIRFSVVSINWLPFHALSFWKDSDEVLGRLVSVAKLFLHAMFASQQVIPSQ